MYFGLPAELEALGSLRSALHSSLRREAPGIERRDTLPPREHWGAYEQRMASWPRRPIRSELEQRRTKVKVSSSTLTTNMRYDEIGRSKTVNWVILGCHS